MEVSIVEEVLLSSSTVDEFDVVGSHGNAMNVGSHGNAMNVGSHGNAMNGCGTTTVSLISIIFSSITSHVVMSAVKK